MPKVSILIVEDEMLVAENLRRRLANLGYPIVGVLASGEAAVEKAIELKPGLILMDIQLAGFMDGVEAADQIKAALDVPIIYLTSFSDDVTLQRAKITEPFGYVLKPYDPETLHITIETALYKHSMEHKLRSAYEELEVWVRERTIANQRLKEEIAERIQVEQALRESELKLRRYADEQALLYSVTATASATLDPHVLLTRVVDVLVEKLSADQACVALVEDVPGYPSQRNEHDLSLHVGEGIDKAQFAALCLDSISPGGDGTQEAGAPDGAAPMLGKMTVPGQDKEMDYACIPLETSDCTLGVLGLAWSQPNPTLEARRDLLLTIGRQVGLALRNAQLYQAALHVDRLQVVNEIGFSLTSTLEYAQVIQAATRQLEKLFAADNITVFEVDRATGQLRPIKSIAASGSAAVKPGGAGKLLAEWVVGKRAPEVVASLGVDPRFQSGEPECARLENCSAMAAPLLSPDRVAGAVLVIKEMQQGYSDDDLQLLQSIAAMLAVAMENARLYQSLKALLEEREQTQAQLLQTEKIAALGRLAASIAHEINNPLQAVQGCLSLIGEEMEGKQRREKMDRYLQIVNSEIERVIEIINRMRDFYRPARQVLEPTAVNAVIDSVLALSAKQLQHSGVTVERRLAEDLPLLELNPDYLKQVFLNLVLNAIDAMPDGGRLSISTCLDDALHSPAVRIEFVDTGLGMPADVLSKLFEPFFTTKDHGSGLGLYVSYTIIETFNGNMSATSQEGAGSTFTILLPVTAGQP